MANLNKLVFDRQVFVRLMAKSAFQAGLNGRESSMHLWCFAQLIGDNFEREVEALTKADLE